MTRRSEQHATHVTHRFGKRQTWTKALGQADRCRIGKQTGGAAPRARTAQLPAGAAPAALGSHEQIVARQVSEEGAGGYLESYKTW
jgi:hypothetical protein